MRNRTIILTGLLVLAAVLSACSGGVASAQGVTPTPGEPPAGQVTRTISVSGSGKAYLTPDIAYVTIGVHTEGKDATETVAGNTTQSQKLTDALTRFGIDAKDIQTTNFSIYPQQQYDNNGKPTGEITYIVDNSVYVTVRDITKVGELLDAAVTAGANSVNGIQFDVADKTQALSDARKAAVEDARRVADELAQAAGVELGAVQSISVNSGAVPVPIMYDRAAEMAAPAAASVPVNPGQLIVTVDVNLVYAIQ